jgi:hypothetical protein
MKRTVPTLPRVRGRSPGSLRLSQANRRAPPCYPGRVEAPATLRRSCREPKGSRWTGIDRLLTRPNSASGRRSRTSSGEAPRARHGRCRSRHRLAPGTLGSARPIGRRAPRRPRRRPNRGNEIRDQKLRDPADRSQPAPPRRRLGRSRPLQRGGSSPRRRSAISGGTAGVGEELQEGPIWHHDPVHHDLEPRWDVTAPADPPAARFAFSGVTLSGARRALFARHTGRERPLTIGRVVAYSSPCSISTDRPRNRTVGVAKRRSDEQLAGIAGPEALGRGDSPLSPSSYGSPTRHGCGR